MEARFSLSTFSTCWALCRSSTGDVVPSCLSLLSLLLFHPVLQRLHIPKAVPCCLLVEREGQKERGCLHGRELLRAALGELSVKCSSCCCFCFDSERVSEEGSTKGDFILSSLPNYPSTATSLHLPGQCSLSLSAAPRSLGTDRALWGPSKGEPKPFALSRSFLQFREGVICDLSIPHCQCLQADWNTATNKHKWGSPVPWNLCQSRGVLQRGSGGREQPLVLVASNWAWRFSITFWQTGREKWDRKMSSETSNGVGPCHSLVCWNVLLILKGWESGQLLEKGTRWDGSLPGLLCCQQPQGQASVPGERTQGIALAQVAAPSCYLRLQHSHTTSPPAHNKQLISVTQVPALF